MNVFTSGDVHLLGGGDHVLEVADDRRPVRRVRVERVRVEAEAGDDEALAPDLRREVAAPAPADRFATSMCEVPGVAPGRPGRRAASTRSRSISKPLPAVQSTTSSSGVFGNGAVSRPSLMRAPPGRWQAREWRADGRRRRPSIDRRRPSAPRAALRAIASLTSISSWPAAKSAYGGSASRPAGEDVGVDRPEQRAERVAEALDVAARQRRRGPPGRAHQRRVAEEQLVRPVAVAEPEVVRRLASPTTPRRPSRRSPTGASSSGRR